MKDIEPPTLDVGPRISSSMAAIASNAIVFTMLPSSVPQQQHSRADHDTAKAEDGRRDLDGVFQAEEPDDRAPCGRQENIHDRAEQGMKHSYWSRRRRWGSVTVDQIHPPSPLSMSKITVTVH
ncbi:hypothetical protein BwSH20_42930 [Bradyrhizobium ottawaense]|nr:hypothetical protein BwSG10_48190 [Bradyrhizobium ottawaense]GMP04629.1 hypothetical protein BwSH20_42930 [Bradyrhizobium ottawaense]GMP05347.1 hypothetical protein BwDG23_48190 [Bradyrhizobium ottawaense]GMP15656.1 hypothetical protein BwSH12_16580 [Bradyrhizobium ottawaense]